MSDLDELVSDLRELSAESGSYTGRLLSRAAEEITRLRAGLASEKEQLATAWAAADRFSWELGTARIENEALRERLRLAEQSVVSLRAEVADHLSTIAALRAELDEYAAEVAELRERLRWHSATDTSPVAGWYVIDRGDEYQAVSIGEGVRLSFRWIRLPVPPRSS